MWDRISKCDVNHEWSASIVQNRGKLRAYFCEVAASFDLAQGTDNGIDPVPGWWRRNVSEFEDQIALFCPGCGVPAKLKGHMDYEETDTYTSSNADLALKSLNKKRNIIELIGMQGNATIDHKVTDYSQRKIARAKQKFKYRVRSLFYRDVLKYLRQMSYELKRSSARGASPASKALLSSRPQSTVTSPKPMTIPNASSGSPTIEKVDAAIH